MRVIGWLCVWLSRVSVRRFLFRFWQVRGSQALILGLIVGLIYLQVRPFSLVVKSRWPRIAVWHCLRRRLARIVGLSLFWRHLRAFAGGCVHW
jgi:hypothetical protein